MDNQTELNRSGVRDINFRNGSIETNSRKIMARLQREGCVHIQGGRHNKFGKMERLSVLLIVPRHRHLTFGVARDIAKKAGWI